MLQVDQTRTGTGRAKKIKMAGRSKRTSKFNRKVAPPKKKDRVEVESDSLAATTNHNPVATKNSALSSVRFTRRTEVLLVPAVNPK